MFREEAISVLAGVHVGPLFWSSVGFCAGRKTGEPREPWSKATTNNKLNPHMVPGWHGTRDTLVGSEGSHHCAILTGPLSCSSAGFCAGKKTAEPSEKPLQQAANQQQIQPTYGTSPASNPGHIGGKRALSPLRHPYGSPILVRCWLLWREENQSTQRKTLGATREPTTNSTHIWRRAGSESNPGHIGGKQALPPLRHKLLPIKSCRELVLVYNFVTLPSGQVS